MNQLNVYRLYDETWAWSCAHCHFGHNIPWEDADSWRDAMERVEAHIRRHRELGITTTWKYAL
jgi:hypothetical protein